MTNLKGSATLKELHRITPILEYSIAGLYMKRMHILLRVSACVNGFSRMSRFSSCGGVLCIEPPHNVKGPPDLHLGVKYSDCLKSERE